LFGNRPDLAEGDDLHREQLRIAMDEPYRTLLGHFRHEIGHSRFHRLVGSSREHLAQFGELFERCCRAAMESFAPSTGSSYMPTYLASIN
jgi:hypothetical protein